MSIYYYKRLLDTVGILTPKQQKRYEQLLEQYESRPPKTQKYATRDEYLSANRQRALERYYRLKDDEEFKQKLKERAKKQYQKRKEAKENKEKENIISTF